MNADALTLNVLQKVWDSVVEQNQLGGDIGIPLSKASTLTQTMVNCAKYGSTAPIKEANLNSENSRLKNFDLQRRSGYAVNWEIDVIYVTTLPSDINDQQILSAFLEPLFDRKTVSPPKWDIDVIVANKHVQKGLHIVSTLNIKEEKLEMNMEQFSNFRFELARAMQTMHAHV